MLKQFSGEVICTRCLLSKAYNLCPGDPFKTHNSSRLRLQCRVWKLIFYSRPYIFDVLTFRVIALIEPTWSIESYLKCHYKLAGSQNYMVPLMEQKNVPLMPVVFACAPCCGPLYDPPRLARLLQNDLLISIYLQMTDSEGLRDTPVWFAVVMREAISHRRECSHQKLAGHLESAVDHLRYLMLFFTSDNLESFFFE